MGLILCQRTWKWEKNTCLQIYVHIYLRKYRNGNTFLIQKKSATRKQMTIWNMDAYTFSFEIAVCFYFDISCYANFNNNIWNIKCLLFSHKDNLVAAEIVDIVFQFNGLRIFRNFIVDRTLCGPSGQLLRKKGILWKLMGYGIYTVCIMFVVISILIFIT